MPRQDYVSRELEYYAALVEALDKLSPADKQSLDDWDKQFVTGDGLRTSDWPGWEHYGVRRHVS